ncbi:MAG: hypothetical protein ABIR18_12480 [Chitinophagaceae bacterium]
MKIVKSISIAFLLSFLLVSKGFSQVAPATIMQYLQSKINIYFLNDPNTATPAFHTIATTSITSNTDGVLFGRGGNNAMSQSARLLLSLFKDRAQRGDGRFQDFVYQVMNLRNKTIDIIFVNDQLHSIDPTFLPQYGFVDTFRVGRNLHIWPTTVMPNSETSAGSIVIGEKVLRGFNNLKQSKNILLDLISSVAIADFRQMHKYWIFTHRLSGGDSMRYTFSLMDARQKTNQGICNAIRFGFDIGERGVAINWYAQKANLVKWSASPTDARSMPIVPNQYWLYNELQTDDMLNRGLALPNPPFSASLTRDYKWMHFGTGGSTTFNPEIAKYAARDEIMLGMLGETYMRFLSVSSFWNALKFDNNRFFTAEPQNRLAIFIENLCLSKLDGRTLAALRTNPPTEKKYLLGIALFDFLSNYGSGGDARELNRWLLAGTISQELIDVYAQVRPAIMTAVGAAASGGFRTQIEAIKTSLHIN